MMLTSNKIRKTMRFIKAKNDRENYLNQFKNASGKYD